MTVPARGEGIKQLGLDVDPDHGVSAAGEVEGDAAGAAAEVEHLTAATRRQLLPEREVGAVGADALHFGRRGNRRHENARGLPGLHRGVSDRHAVIAAGCGDNTCLGDVARQEIGESPARLERASVLEQLQLENQWRASESEIGGIDLDERCAPDVRADDGVGPRDPLAHSGDFHELVL